MKLQDKILYMSFGAGLVVLGMVLNSLVSGDADAQEGVKDAEDVVFRTITCETLFIGDGYKQRGRFGLSDDGDAMLKIYGDDGKTPVAYLGENPTYNEMNFVIRSKSKTDKREVTMMIGPNGGRLNCRNKMGESVAFIGVGNKGGGVVNTRDKNGYTRQG